MQKSIRKNIIKKNVAEYQRTSSGGQDLELQASTNAEYLKKYPADDIMPFIDFDISATKLAIHERPALNRMLKLLEDGYISTVICYDRDRLARNVYEYIFIAKKFYEHNIKVVFTATDAPPFSTDLFVETWYGLSAQFEGQRIKTRLSDALKRNPPSLIGYKKNIIKHGNGANQRYYQADLEQKEQLYNLFKDFSEVEDLEQIFNIIIKYQKLLKRSEFRIIDILKTPFYSAHYESIDCSYHPLYNVEAIIPLDLFKKVQEKIEEFDPGISFGISKSQQEGNLVPLCGKCNKSLKFKKGKIGESGSYYCTNHRKFSINVTELNDKIGESIDVVKNNISFSSIKKITNKIISNHITELNKSSDRIHTELEKLCIKFSKKYSPFENSDSEQQLMNRIDQLREKLCIVEDNILSLQTLTGEIHLLEDITKQQLDNLGEKDKFLLADLLIENVIIYEDHILFNYYFNEFFKGDEDINVS
ncbi:recombinase family protein [Metabacillus fastidiosus]|uniref:recombinase family protein n=1 Tax=Metabacillus fastidiosus TaxID=1458 RepID=UPI002DB98AA9|nr:recombinase family protein [Metabacillus fastidiosus]MEC2076102.1 recombinase family protein [Metabacillus fastidiosus]